LCAFFGNVEIGEIDLLRCRDYRDARRNGRIGGGSRRPDRTGSDSTIRRELVVLGSAAKHALKHKRITQMPVIELPAVQSTGQDDEVAYYSKEEIKALLDNSTGELHHFIAITYATGARRASIEGLRRAQVQWDRRRILLQPEGKVATKKRQPIVPIFKSMEPHLRALWDASPNDRLFVRSDFYQPFRQLCERLGMVDRSHPHLLRHSRITHLLQDGRNIYDVAKLVGDTTGTIEKVYGHSSSEWLANLSD
jgi:integrase